MVSKAFFQTMFFKACFQNPVVRPPFSIYFHNHNSIQIFLNLKK